MDLEKIKGLAISSQLFVDPEVSFLAEGYGNFNYLIVEKGKKAVLRIKKSDEEQFVDSLEREYHILSFFESQGIDYCPKALYFDKEENFFIESFLEGEKLSIKDFMPEQINQYALQLYRIFSLPLDSFFDYCEKVGYSGLERSDPVTSLKKYGFNRFEQAKKGSVDEKVLTWLEEKLDDNLAYLKEQKASDNYGFSYGDVQSRVIIGDNGEIFLYDFEHASIALSAGLGYIKIHGNMSDSQFDYLVQRYAAHSKRSKADLLDEIKHNERITRVNDVVWAAMKWAKTDEQKFKDLTYKRIELAEKLFSS